MYALKTKFNTVNNLQSQKFLAQSIEKTKPRRMAT